MVERLSNVDTAAATSNGRVLAGPRWITAAERSAALLHRSTWTCLKSFPDLPAAVALTVTGACADAARAFGQPPNRLPGMLPLPWLDHQLDARYSVPRSLRPPALDSKL